MAPRRHGAYLIVPVVFGGGLVLGGLFLGLRGLLFSPE
jgi:hypothetical protein